MNKTTQDQSITILKALADEVRLSVAKHIASSKKPVPSCDAVNSCTKVLEMSQPAMSHHFKKLVESGVLIAKKRGIENYYQFNHALCKKHGINIFKL